METLEMLMIKDVEGLEWPRTLKLEGKLLEPWVRELAKACARSRREVGSARLDLSDVSFVDAAGIRLLRDLIRQGTEIVACSDFVAELIREGP